MRPITAFMIAHWRMEHFDWMYYPLDEGEAFSFHHLIIPKSEGGLAVLDNGAILVKHTSHEYLHLIAEIDRDIFDYITNILIQVNLQEYMTTYTQYAQINNALKSFEREHCGDYTNKGKMLIKERYTRRIL